MAAEIILVPASSLFAPFFLHAFSGEVFYTLSGEGRLGSDLCHSALLQCRYMFSLLTLLVCVCLGISGVYLSVCVFAKTSVCCQIERVCAQVGKTSRLPPIFTLYGLFQVQSRQEASISKLGYNWSLEFYLLET